MKKAALALAAITVALSLQASPRKSSEVLAGIVPAPQSIVEASGFFKVRGADVSCDKVLDAKTRKAVMKFAGNLSAVCGKECGYSEKNNGKGIAFVPAEGLGAEGYRIKVSKKAVVVEASARAGFLHAIQTLRQMLPVAVYGTQPSGKEDWTLPCCTIEDSPRYAYRGMLLDCCRHIFSLDEIRRCLDIMAVYKMNRLHWHLTEDQGWRIEIKKYPLLTEVGAFRSGTQIGKDRKSSDGIRYGGYYTQDQVRELIAYADELGITIVPEVDLPGHMQAALASYPEFGCAGSAPYSVRTCWGVSRQVLNVGKEETMRFLEDVVSELADLFPGEYFHIGGDECPKDEWKTDPDCQAKIRELGLVTDSKASAEQRLQNYVTARIQKCLAAKGKKIIGWDEILEGDLAPGATVMSWRGTKGGKAAAAKGFDVLMTPNTFCYLDYLQLQDEKAQPLGSNAHRLPLSKVYSFEPSAGMSPGAASHIKGVQANLWTEYIPTPEHLEFMMFPRLFAISEVQWCRPDRKDYDRFTSSLENHQKKILDLQGYNYCKVYE